MCDSHAGLVGCGPPEPPSIFPSRPCSSIRKRSAGLQRKSHTRELPRSIAWLRSRRAIARIIVAIAPIVCHIAVSTHFEATASAQTTGRSESTDWIARFIAEASARFAVPARWIRAVMQVESAGDEHATSSRGAMGLMQLMPGTWVGLSVRYGLGLLSILATTSWRAPPTSRKCTIALDQQASLRHITQVRRDMNSTSRRASRFHRKPRPTSPPLRHCAATGRVNTPHFASNVRFLGRKLHCLLSVASAVTDLASAFAVLKRRNSTASLSAAFHTETAIRWSARATIM